MACTCLWLEHEWMALVNTDISVSSCMVLSGPACDVFQGCLCMPWASTWLWLEHEWMALVNTDISISSCMAVWSSRPCFLQVPLKNRALTLSAAVAVHRGSRRMTAATPTCRHGEASDAAAATCVSHPATHLKHASPTKKLLRGQCAMPTFFDARNLISSSVSSVPCAMKVCRAGWGLHSEERATLVLRAIQVWRAPVCSSEALQRWQLAASTINVRECTHVRMLMGCARVCMCVCVLLPAWIVRG